MSATLDRLPPVPFGPLPVTPPRPHETAALRDVGGLEITDFDLARPLAADQRDWLLARFREHPILVFRGQRLSKQQQYDFTLNFGEIESQHVNRLINAERYAAVHTVCNLDADGKPTETMAERGNYFWHTDKSYHAVPSLLTMLHAVELPPVGGETQFANMTMGYAALPNPVKARIADWRAVHSWEASRIHCGSRPATEEQKRERPPVDHPVVRTHPDTGTRSVYIGNHAAHVLGMDPVAGRAALMDVQAQAIGPSNVYSHRWQKGDLVLWDNRCLLHRALVHADMGLHPRVLHRTVVKGSVPY